MVVVFQDGGGYFEWPPVGGVGAVRGVDVAFLEVVEGAAFGVAGEGAGDGVSEAGVVDGEVGGVVAGLEEEVEFEGWVVASGLVCVDDGPAVARHFLFFVRYGVGEGLPLLVAEYDRDAVGDGESGGVVVLGVVVLARFVFFVAGGGCEDAGCQQYGGRYVRECMVFHVACCFPV